MTTVGLDEAVAYCAWLDRELLSWPGLPAELRAALDHGKVTLPSEAEWEKAARGADSRIYPWGDEWNPERANTSEAGIGSTSAVGCFRSGKSPFRCEDMSGNVWQWTRSLEKSAYPAKPKARGKREAPGGNEAGVVVRGSPFTFEQRIGHPAYRVCFNSEYGFSDLGFRVVVSPSFSET
jgi:formylglycine-generating enzyme required for sulfatase activity